MMSTYRVRVFLVADLLKKITVEPGFAVEAKSRDAAINKAQSRLIQDFGYASVEAINVEPGGGLLAYVHRRI